MYSPPGGSSILVCFLGSREEPLGGEALYRQTTQACNLVLGFLDELPGGDEFLPGSVGLFNSIYDFCAFLHDFVQREIKG